MEQPSPGPAVTHLAKHDTAYFEQKAPRHNAQEQKRWIQCTLNAAKHRGEDWIESNFSDDETIGCSSCLPDIVIVNDIQKNSKDEDANANTNTNRKNEDALAVKAPAPWQRILIQTDPTKFVSTYPPDDCCAPSAVCTMSNCQSASTLAPVKADTYLYSHKRFETTKTIG
jgi:hypothetical protein